MNTTFKALAITALMTTASAPAFAAAHMDMETMTCAQYNELSAEDQMIAANLAISEIDDGANGESMGGGNKGSEPIDTDTTAAEATDGDTSSGNRADGDEDDTTEQTMRQNAVDQLNEICARSLDTMVSEAAAGLEAGR